jgi:hypothetical protein
MDLAETENANVIRAGRVLNAVQGFVQITVWVKESVYNLNLNAIATLVIQEMTVLYNYAKIIAIIMGKI